ncbi:hypothetical protein BELL_0198g00100 [Botrytis elliptica]|uniref:Uncharacterized protein n=1 Tax=Botrytis elliptica TaxID=278938 RepID=A0A4Z1JPJ9_9HELO|nr:hypothetical protein BELL_0198g00100 [Botrytis elliptica]
MPCCGMGNVIMVALYERMKISGCESCDGTAAMILCILCIINILQDVRGSCDDPGFRPTLERLSYPALGSFPAHVGCDYDDRVQGDQQLALTQGLN